MLPQLSVGKQIVPAGAVGMVPQRIAYWCSWLSHDFFITAMPARSRAKSAAVIMTQCSWLCGIIPGVLTVW